MIISNLTKCETCSFLNTSNSATGCGSFSHPLHKPVIIAGSLTSSNTNKKKKLRTEIRIISVRVVTAVQVEQPLNVGSIPSDEQNPFHSFSSTVTSFGPFSGHRQTCTPEPMKDTDYPQSLEEDISSCTLTYKTS